MSKTCIIRKNNRFATIAQLIAQFELNLKNASQNKEAQFVLLTQKLRTLQDFVEVENDKYSNLHPSQMRSEQETLKLITDLDRHAKRLLEVNQKERIEQEKKITYVLNQSIDTLTQDINREAVVQLMLTKQLQSSHDYLDIYLNEDLPKIADDLQNEIQERREVEERIYHQFTEQIRDLRDLFDREKKEREIREEDIVENLREVQIRITEALKRHKREREVTEGEMIVLVEQVIEKLKIEMLEMNI